MRDPSIPKSGNNLEEGRSGKPPQARPDTKADIAAFVEKARAMTPGKSGSGRLIFALDATMSRQPTWDLACQLQAEMFYQARRVGGPPCAPAFFSRACGGWPG